VWQCGGSVEVLPCSRIAHIERAHKPYTEDLTAHVRRNALRVAEVWMDEFKSHVYMAWNIPQEDSGIDIGDITARKALRKQLQCKTFRWYLVSVYPEMRMYSDIIAYGVVRSPRLGFHPDISTQVGPVVDLWTRGWAQLDPFSPASSMAGLLHEQRHLLVQEHNELN
ncbi:GALNT18, partial [Cervus elaphus hippelaphus]